MGRLLDICSVNCCFLTVCVVLLAVFIPLMWPAPNQAIINAVQRKQYKLIHTLVDEELARIDQQRKGQPGAKPATIDDIEFGSGRSSMHVAAMHGDVPILKYFHHRGASIHAVKESDGRVPLHFAASFGTAEMVAQLLRWGAEVDARAHFGWTPLHKAVLLSNHGIVETLLEHGANPNLHVEGSFNALQCALIYSDERMIFLLLKHGAYVEEGEMRYDEFAQHRDTVLRMGLITEEQMEQARQKFWRRRADEQTKEEPVGVTAADDLDTAAFE